MQRSLIISCNYRSLDSKIRFYRVKNIPVGHQNMKEAFNQLKKPPLKPDLLNTARKCYLENIANDIKNDRGEQVQKALRFRYSANLTSQYWRCCQLPNEAAE